MILYRMDSSFVLEQNGQIYPVGEKSLDELLVLDDLQDHLDSVLREAASSRAFDESKLMPPIGNQEVWAAGVTYLRSRAARIAESKDAGGGDFYDRVYTAERPELFFKSLAHKVVGPNGTVGLRSDSQWSVPEPELALVINPRGQIVGYTIGNDMSSRDIEGQNPLYLPQAKVYDRSCALGPGILITKEALPAETQISLEIQRGSHVAYSGTTALSQMKRRPQELVDYLYRDQTFRNGCILLTGTGIVPPDTFTLMRGDTIRIAIDGIGVLVNTVG